MCGLTAIFSYTRERHPIERTELERIRDAMAPRGPDGSGAWLDVRRGIGLAHRRLAILDLSDAAAQPMATSDGLLRVVFNGEVYNYRELRAELTAKGHRFV